MQTRENWFERHKILGTILIIFGAIILISIIFEAITGSEDSAEASDMSSLPEQKSGDLSNIPLDDASENNLPVEEIMEDHSLGERFIHGNFAYTFNSVETASEIGGNDYFDGAKAEGIFLIVDVTIENIGQETETFLGDAIVVIDELGRVFETDDEAWVYSGEDNNFMFEQMQPGLPKTGKIIFDVPKNIKGKFRVSKDSFGFSEDYAYVSWN